MSSAAAIITGADEGHAHYLHALLNSIRAFNDTKMPVFVIDFGLSKETAGDLKAKHPGVALLPIDTLSKRTDEDIEKMSRVPGVLDLPWKGYVLKTMRKLCLADWTETKSWLWLDADTLVLAPISQWLPPKVTGRLMAGRNSRQSLAFHFKDRNPLVREALASQLFLRTGAKFISPTSWNSGVVFTDAAYYKSMVDYARERFLVDFGPYLMGDQAVLNAAMALQGLMADPLPAGVNVSIRNSTDEECALVEQEAGPSITLQGRACSVYHFLHIKPAQAHATAHPVSQLFYRWLNHSD